MVTGEVMVEAKVPSSAATIPKVTIKVRFGGKESMSDICVHPMCTFGSSGRTDALVSHIGGHEFCIPSIIPPTAGRVTAIKY
jgi:hypothetical protein